MNYLVGDPKVWIIHTVQDHMPSTLHILSTLTNAPTMSSIPRGTLGPIFRSKRVRRGITERTVEKIEPNDGPIRGPPEVDRFTLPHNRISQRDKITDSGTRPDVLQVRPRWTVQTTLVEIFELLFR